MQLSRKALDNYTDAMNDVIRSGQDELRTQLRSIDYSRPVSEWRDTVVGVMEACCGGTSQMGAGIAAAFYDGVRERAVGEMMGAYHQTGRSPEATRKAVQYFIGTLLDGDYDAFEELCVQRLDYETKRAAGQCIAYNARNDPAGMGEVRYARVPTGEETCEFCIMLASRGPVYHTFDTAGGDDHFHPHCDCRIVPFFGTYVIGDSRRGSIMSIEGYDPDAYYEQYLQGKFKHGGGGGGGGGRAPTPASWTEAKRQGVVTLGSIGEIQRYIREATTYEDLTERINLISSEWDYYAISDKNYELIMQDLRDARKRILNGS